MTTKTLPAHEATTNPITLTVAARGIADSDVRVEMRHDKDGRWRWYEQADDDFDTEISGATPMEALDAAIAAWGAFDLSGIEEAAELAAGLT